MKLGASPSPSPTKPGISADAKKWAEAENAAAEFETMFMDLVIKGMRQTAKPEDASNASEIYTGMLDSEYAKTMTGARSFGVRDMILDWMKTADPSLAATGQELQRAKSGSAAALDAYRAQAGVRAEK